LEKFKIKKARSYDLAFILFNSMFTIKRIKLIFVTLL
jgi:hypothetical protein